MAIPVRIPRGHKQIGYTPGTIMRSASPWFAPPVPGFMREPGTNYVTIITAPGPHDTEHGGSTGGTVVGANNAVRKTYPGPLTRKGG